MRVFGESFIFGRFPSFDDEAEEFICNLKSEMCNTLLEF